jgi:hypothetical protein
MLKPGSPLVKTQAAAIQRLTYAGKNKTVVSKLIDALLFQQEMKQKLAQ